MEKFTYIDYLEYLAEVQRDFAALLALYKISNGQELTIFPVPKTQKYIFTLKDDSTPYIIENKNPKNYCCRHSRFF